MIPGGMTLFGRKDRSMSRLEKNDRRDDLSVGLQAASLMTSVVSLGLTLATLLNRKPADGRDGDWREDPVYYMSESMGLIRWE